MPTSDNRLPRFGMVAALLAPFRGTVLHYAVAYLDAVVLGATRDMLDRQVRGLRKCHRVINPSSKIHAAGTDD